MKKLKDLAEIDVTGVEGRKAKRSDSGALLLGLKNLSENGILLRDEFMVSGVPETKLLRKGDLVFIGTGPRMGDILEYNLNFPSVIGSIGNCFVLRCDPKWKNKLIEAIKLNRYRLIKAAKGITMQRISKETLADLDIL